MCAACDTSLCGDVSKLRQQGLGGPVNHALHSQRLIRERAGPQHEHVPSFCSSPNVFTFTS